VICGIKELPIPHINLIAITTPFLFFKMDVAIDISVIISIYF